MNGSTRCYLFFVIQMCDAATITIAAHERRGLILFYNSAVLRVREILVVSGASNPLLSIGLLFSSPYYSLLVLYITFSAFVPQHQPTTELYKFCADSAVHTALVEDGGPT